MVIAVNLNVNFSFEGRPQGLIEAGIRSFNIMQKRQAEDVIADVEIQPDLQGIPGTDLGNQKELINRGREAAEEALPDILALLEKKQN